MFEAFYLLGTLTLTFNGIRPFGINLGLSDAFYLVALAALVVNGVYRKLPMRQWLPGHPFWLAAGLILAGGLLSSLIAVDPLGSLLVTLKASFLFSIWISMGVVMVGQRRREGLVIASVICVALVSSLVAVWDRLTGSILGATIADLLGNRYTGVNLAGLALIYGRYGGIIGHTNIQSEFTLVMIPIVLDLGLFHWQSGKRPLALGLFAIVTALVWGNYLTGSIAGLIGVCIAFVLVFGCTYIRELVRWSVPLLFITATGILLLLLLTINVQEGPVQALVMQVSGNQNVSRVLTTTGPGRFQLLLDTWSLIGNNPITGFGMDILAGDRPDVFTAAGGGVHNAILRSWLGGGVIVFLGVAYAYLRALGLSWRTIVKYVRGSRREYFLGLAVSTLGWMINDMAQPSFYQRFTWLTVVILFGLLVRQSRSVVITPSPRLATASTCFQEAGGELPSPPPLVPE